MFSDQVRCGFDVVVEEQHELALGGGDAGVSGLGRAGIRLAFRVHCEAALRLATEPGLGIVSRSVVDYDDLETARVDGLTLEACQHAFEPRSSVERWQYDTDPS